MKEFKSLYEVWQYCQELISLPTKDIENMSREELASLFIQAEKRLISEVYLLAYDLGFKPVDSWFENSIRLSDYEGVLLGNITIGFDMLFFSKDYNYIISVIIHQLCRTIYEKRTKTFWKLYEKCLRSKGLISSDYNGWKTQQNGIITYEVPFKNYHRSSKYYKIKEKIFEKNWWGEGYDLRSEYNDMRAYKYESFNKWKNLPMCLCGESKLWNVSQMIRQILDLESFVMVSATKKEPLKLHDLKYLKDENEVLCLLYDSRVKKDEDRISYCVNQMNTDDRYDFSPYTSCLINLEVDENHPLNLEEDLDKLKKIKISNDVNLIITYSLTIRCHNLNKCEMMVVFSK